MKNSTVLVTGHTGFKGSWLSAWLAHLGANVVGVSLDIPSTPSHFACADMGALVNDHRQDIRNGQELRDLVVKLEPDYVFHLAAQPLVRKAYDDPVETYSTNVMGTINVLEALRALKKPCVAVFITSDKCYDNVEWVWGYRENDRLGGPDPYSASKGAAEIAIRSYVKSYFPDPHGIVKIGIGRAGNVIGGGDWAADRIVPDCVKAWSNNQIVPLRNPHATRPWQHVLEPLSGYLSLAKELAIRPELHGEPFNFGPPANQNHTVMELVKQMGLSWKQVRWEDMSSGKGPYESGLLKLNCDKALHLLRWAPVLNFEETVAMTAEWYQHYYQHQGESILPFTIAQIESYSQLARARGLSWAQ